VTLVGGLAGALTSSVVIDASVWVSRLLPQDDNHKLASAWVDTHILNGGTFVAPTLLVIEASASVSRRTKNIADAHAAIRQLNGLSIIRLVQVDQSLANDAAAIAADLGLRGADATYVALARQLGIPLVSFDYEQLMLAQNLVQTIRP
jgi:predicted nucleic acid-binding protein